jgi:hypothetical protein
MPRQQYSKSLLFKFGVTVTALALLVVHAFVNFAADTTTIILLALAALPWFATMIEELELPGQWRIKFHDLSQRQTHLEDDVEALMFLLAHFLNKRQLDILRHLDQPTPSYPVEINPADQFFRLDFSQLLNLGLIEPIDPNKWLFDNPGRRDAAHYHRITEQGRRYLTLLKAVENKVGKL